MNTQSTDIREYSLVNTSGMRVNILNYGGTLKNIFVPDRNKNFADVALGFDTLSEYTQKENPFFGCLTGRYANRIARGKFTIDGNTYQLPLNDNGNTLHGGDDGFNRRYWDARTEADGNVIRLFLVSPNGDEGFPGSLSVEVTYSLTDLNELVIRYKATTNMATPVNLTNHNYFNLSGQKELIIDDHELFIDADRYVPVDAEFLPSGSLASVADSLMDFRSPKRIGNGLHQVAGGYDHTWVLNKKGKDAPSAAVFHPASGRYMELFTTQPGVQFYTGNFLDGTLTGKNGIRYPRNGGFCLETQHFPDSPNQPDFPNTILRPGELFDQTTVFSFSVR